MADYRSIYVHGLYSDLLRQFIDHGDDVYMVSPCEKSAKDSWVIEEPHAQIIKVPTLTMEKTNIIKKGLSILTIDNSFRKGINKHLSGLRFDIVIYPTPPITLLGSVKYIKNRDKAMTYLLLKDIFPQNAVDIGMMSATGIKGVLYRYFRYKEKQLYKASDYIGCMSQANVDYVLKNNPFIDKSHIEVCPNSVEVVDMSVDEKTRISIRKKYAIPLEKKVFVFGGNLGRPQGIPFMIDCLKAVKEINDAYFLIVGDGTEYGKIEKYLKESKQENVRLMQRLPREDYDTMVGACDVGLLFLDHRFTIPNYPSRLISYMQAKVPVLAVTDPNTDIGEDIVEGGFGWWSESNDAESFRELVMTIIDKDLKQIGQTGYDYLLDHFSVDRAYDTIMAHFTAG